MSNKIKRNYQFRKQLQQFVVSLRQTPQYSTISSSGCLYGQEKTANLFLKHKTGET